MPTAAGPEQFVTQLPEVILGRLDDLLRGAHLVGVVNRDRPTRLKREEPLIRLDGSSQLVMRSFEATAVAV